MNKDDRVKVLLISSVQPSDRTNGGELVLKRYLVDNPAMNCRVLPRSAGTWKGKLFRNLAQSSFRHIIYELATLSPPLPSLKLMDQAAKCFQPDVILTVAWGTWHLGAARTAERWGLPLVTIFQDWWPDLVEGSRLTQRLVERQVRSTCARSRGVICVSRGLQEELGSPANSVVLHDLPSKVKPPEPRPAASDIFRLIYFGNLSDYGPMVEEALEAMKDAPDLRLDVFGPKPNWKPGIEEEFRHAGLYHGLVSPDQIHREVGRADAVLVTMCFQPGMARRTRTSFPSKFIEAVQLERPVILWAPADSSASQVAAEFGSALLVTEPEPRRLVGAARQLARDPVLRQRILSAAGKMQRSLFSPDLILMRFNGILSGLKRRKSWQQIKDELSA